MIRDNEHNYALGNIMVGVDLLTYQKEVICCEDTCKGIV